MKAKSVPVPPPPPNIVLEMTLEEAETLLHKAYREMGSGPYTNQLMYALEEATGVDRQFAKRH